MADLGSAHDHLDGGLELFEDGDDLARLEGIPNINSEADDLGFLSEQSLRDVEWALVDIKLDQLGMGDEIPEIGEEATQSEGCVNELRVEGAEEDVRHGFGT